MKNWILIFLIPAFVVSCKPKTAPEKQPEQTAKAQAADDTSDWAEVVQSVARIDSYDNGRILETGQGFFVAENLFVTKYSVVANANRAEITPYDSDLKYEAKGYVAFDRINDLIILKVEGISRKPVSLFTEIAPVSAKSICILRPEGNVIPLKTGKVLSFSNVRGIKLYRITNSITKNSFGMPVFVSTKQTIGIAFSETVDYELRSFVIPATYIASLLKNKNETPNSLVSLRENNNQDVAAENSRIKGLLIETGMGNIGIRLFNETPAYRDNFIKLTKEGYYDSLLIHRVIAGFGIQSGAADTRYAAKDDVVGWKGPGYTLPAHIVGKYFHKRGMIGSPRKPDTENSRRRSDGSQYYIVSGRLYSDSELDDLEKANNYKFSAEQRQVYKTIGGAPHLDGTYTVFGEVTSGMEVVDEISKVDVNADSDFRPLKDIRVKRITILK